MLNRMISRMVILFPVITASIFIVGAFAIKLSYSNFDMDVRDISRSDLESNSNEPENYILKGIVPNQDACCGHVDKTPPVVTLVSPANNSYIIPPGGVNINLTITDDNPMEDFLAEQVLFHWSGEQSNKTLSAPYDVLSPTDKGSHVLYVYTLDAAGNWGSVVCYFTVGFPPPFIKLISPTNTSVILLNTTIDLEIADIYSGVNQSLFHWNDATNVTFTAPYDIFLPNEIGTYRLYVYAQNGDGNWSKSMFVFGATDDASSVVIATTTTEPTSTTLGRRTSGFLFIPMVFVFLGSILFIKWKKRR
ncbi:hypothetical protein CEE45_11840 [Candidatus Heimdallarchaeota archaeon B3_Heim]|nr:MAG: hypothetical protein CEE45_11840 [Candidatus Heimdallarchaeota archaeon B3_Heim]